MKTKIVSIKSLVFNSKNQVNGKYGDILVEIKTMTPNQAMVINKEKTEKRTKRMISNLSISLRKNKGTPKIAVRKLKNGDFAIYRK